MSDLTYIRKHFESILTGIDIAQSKGAFKLNQSAILFSSLQKMNEFVTNYEHQYEHEMQNKNITILPAEKVISEEPKKKKEPQEQKIKETIQI